MTRVRIRFAKLGKIRWTSHRDVARMWERAFRRVQLPLAYSAGYSRVPRSASAWPFPPVTSLWPSTWTSNWSIPPEQPILMSAPCPAGCRRLSPWASTLPRRR